MTLLTAMRGYPGSGKTTEARRLADSGSNANVVGRDFIREMLFDKYYLYVKPDPQREDMVTIVENATIGAQLRAGINVIVDDCNVNPRYLRSLRDLAAKCGAEFIVYDVPTPAGECIIRDDTRRDRSERYVGEAVIRKMAKRHPIKNWPNIVAKPAVDIVPVEFNPDLPDAVIFDIDGTLTTGPNDRSPYDYTKVSQDVLAEDVAWMNGIMATTSYDLAVFIMSGRDGTPEVRRDTIQWLHDNGIIADALYMRPDDMVDGHGNKVSDVVVKLHLFNEHIRGKYNVRMVFDDRNQVVDLWRQLGLTCAQVREGNF